VIVYLYTKFHLPSCSGSLALTQEDECQFHAAKLLLYTLKMWSKQKLHPVQRFTSTKNFRAIH